MSDRQESDGALEALLAVRAADFDEVPVELLKQVLALEQAAQFESDRRPTVAKLRSLILAEGDG